MAGGRRNRTRVNQAYHKSAADHHGSSNVQQNVNNSSHETTANTQSLPICHPNIPNLERLGNISFEILFILYLLTALFCQYIYLFKTIWWYPVALPPSTTALNFHLIDKNLTVFIGLVLFRRIIWSILWNVIRPRSDNSAALLVWLITCFCTSIVWFAALAFSIYYIFSTSSFVSILILCYPLIFWIPFTLISPDSSFHLILSWLSLGDYDNQQQGKYPDSSNGISVPLGRLLDQPETIGDLKTSYSNLGNALDANQVRFEVKLLRQDFNSRLSEIVFSSMISAYYVGLVPMFFMKPHQYYDMTWCLQHTVLIFVNSFVFMTAHLLHPHYLHVLHKCASLLGGYQKVDDPNMEEAIRELPTSQTSVRQPVEVLMWTKMTVFPQSVYVCHKNTFYKSLCDHNTAEPDDYAHYRFYLMFSDPLRVINWLLLLLFIVTLYQLKLILTSSKWDQIITLALMEFFSYYILFRLLQDRIILGKAYYIHKQLYSDIYKSS